MYSFSSSDASIVRAGLPFSRCSLILRRKSTSAMIFLSPPLAILLVRSILRSMSSMSEKISSKFIVSASRARKNLSLSAIKHGAATVIEMMATKMSAAAANQAARAKEKEARAAERAA